MMNNNFKISLAQMSMSEDKKENLIKGLTLLEKAADQGSDLILYPEVQLSPFFAQFPANEKGCCGGLLGPKAVKSDDIAFKMFAEISRSHHIAASPNFYYDEGGKSYDASFLYDKNGEMVGCQKMVQSRRERGKNGLLR